MSLLFAVFHAITGSKAAPATHNMPRDCRHVLQHMANRADNDSHLFDFAAATVEADANLCAAVVRRCIAELAARGWLVFHGWSGPRNNAHRVYEVRAEGSGWPKSAAMARETPTQRRARLGVPPRGNANRSALPPDGGPGCDGVATRGATGWRPGVPPDGDLPPDLPPLLPLREPPIAAPGSPPGVQALPGFEAEAAAAKKPAKVAKPRKPPAAPKAPKVLAADQYAAAYIAGHAAAGGTIAALTKDEKGFLGRAANAHARYRDDTPITGDELVTWFRKRAEDFRRHVEDFSRHTGGASPRGFLAWLNNGHDGASRPWAPGTKPAPLPHAPTPLRMPPGMDTPEARAEARAIVLEAFPQYRSTLEALPNG